MGEELKLHAYVDASFGTHSDGRSHTGIVIQLGGATIFCKSTKQGLVTKSSTEAELVAASDSIPIVVLMSTFLSGLGLNLTPVLYQDNLSTISLIRDGSKSQRTRHINVRYFLLKERLNRDFNLQHQRASGMIADIMTKPMSGNLMRNLRDTLLGQTFPNPNPCKDKCLLAHSNLQILKQQPPTRGRK